MGLSVHSRSFPTDGIATSIGHSASGLRTYARVIPAGVYRPPSRRTYLRGDHRRWILALCHPGQPSTMSLIKSHRDRTRRPAAFLVAVSSVQRREYLSITKLRFPILAVERVSPIETSTLSPSRFIYSGGRAARRKEKRNVHYEIVEMA